MVSVSRRQKRKLTGVARFEGPVLPGQANVAIACGSTMEIVVNWRNGGSILRRQRLSCSAKRTDLTRLHHRRLGHIQPSLAGLRPCRSGAAAIDQVLLLAAMFSLGGVALWLGSQLIDLVYEYVVAWVGWPF
jgi:hypothetical protein